MGWAKYFEDNREIWINNNRDKHGKYRIKNPQQKQSIHPIDPMKFNDKSSSYTLFRIICSLNKSNVEHIKSLRSLEKACNLHPSRKDELYSLYHTEIKKKIRMIINRGIRNYYYDIFVAQKYPSWDGAPQSYLPTVVLKYKSIKKEADETLYFVEIDFRLRVF